MTNVLVAAQEPECINKVENGCNNPSQQFVLLLSV